MADLMTFPKTADEFMEQYKIVDTEEVYTNGAELVPIFRMKQWFEHSEKHGRWMEYNYPGNEHVYCSNCKEEYYVDDLLMGRNDYPAYCPNCGATMGTEEGAEE